MPPTRGHDLKLKSVFRPEPGSEMPPTRGHDLKLLDDGGAAGGRDAPHTGARLETLLRMTARLAAMGMPPTRGHDLKPEAHRRHQLELGCPPHGGTT